MRIPRSIAMLGGILALTLAAFLMGGLFTSSAYAATQTISAKTVTSNMQQVKMGTRVTSVTGQQIQGIVLNSDTSNVLARNARVTVIEAANTQYSQDGAIVREARVTPGSAISVNGLLNSNGTIVAREIATSTLDRAIQQTRSNNVVSVRSVAGQIISVNAMDLRLQNGTLIHLTANTQVFSKINQQTFSKINLPNLPFATLWARNESYIQLTAMQAFSKVNQQAFSKISLPNLPFAILQAGNPVYVQGMRNSDGTWNASQVFVMGSFHLAQQHASALSK